jgi:hypothetical protein
MPHLNEKWRFEISQTEAATFNEWNKVRFTTITITDNISGKNHKKIVQKA